METLAGLPQVSEPLLWSVIRDHAQALRQSPRLAASTTGRSSPFSLWTSSRTTCACPPIKSARCGATARQPERHCAKATGVLVDRRAANMPITDGLYIVKMNGVPFLRHFSVRPNGRILALMGSAALPPIEMPQDILTPENIVGKVVVIIVQV